VFIQFVTLATGIKNSELFAKDWPILFGEFDVSLCNHGLYEGHAFRHRPQPISSPWARRIEAHSPRGVLLRSTAQRGLVEAHSPRGVLLRPTAPEGSC